MGVCLFCLLVSEGLSPFHRSGRIQGFISAEAHGGGPHKGSQVTAHAVHLLAKPRPQIPQLSALSYETYDFFGSPVILSRFHCELSVWALPHLNKHPEDRLLSASRRYSEGSF